ncbi:MAG TPA: hypothetical protein V6D08_05620 [Candidatus Obscuribacterales bacterium]
MDRSQSNRLRQRNSAGAALSEGDSCCGREYVSRAARMQTLPTGDRLVEQRGVQRLLTPDGDVLCVLADGRASLHSSKTVTALFEDGISTIFFSCGDYVQFDSAGIVSVRRGERAVSLRQPSASGSKSHAA